MKSILLILILTLLVSCQKTDYKYDMAMAQLGVDNYGAIKWNKQTGEAWYRINYKWKYIQEEIPIEKGSYIIKVTGGDKYWNALRIETNTGKTWQCIGSKWIHNYQPRKNNSFKGKSSKN